MNTLKTFCVCFVLLILSFPIFGQAADEQAVREIVVKFNEAIQYKSVENLKQVTNVTDNTWQNEFDKGEFAQFPLKSFTIRSVKIEGERATVRVFWERLDAKTNQIVNGYGLNHRILFLQKTISGWKIVGNPTAENELISQIIAADSDDKRKQLIREERELNTFRMLFVILFRLKNEGNYEISKEYFNLAEWFGDEFYKGKNELAFFNNRVNILNARAANQVSKQTAMLKQLKKPAVRHPFFWAGFIAIGKLSK